jgi:hypothetical protein
MWKSMVPIAALLSVVTLAAPASAVTYTCRITPCRSLASEGPVPAGTVFKLRIVDVSRTQWGYIPFGVSLSQRATSVSHLEGQWSFDPQGGPMVNLPRDPIGATIVHTLRSAGPITWGANGEVRQFVDKGDRYVVMWFLWVDPVTKQDMTVTMELYK